MNQVLLLGTVQQIRVFTRGGPTALAKLIVKTRHRVPVADGFEELTTWNQVTAKDALALSLRSLGKGSKVLVVGYAKGPDAPRSCLGSRGSLVIATDVQVQRRRRPAPARRAAS